jgi:hypothetical protein
MHAIVPMMSSEDMTALAQFLQSMPTD